MNHVLDWIALFELHWVFEAEKATYCVTQIFAVHHNTSVGCQAKFKLFSDNLSVTCVVNDAEVDSESQTIS